MPDKPLHDSPLGHLDEWRLARAGKPFGGSQAQPWSGVWLFMQGDFEFFANDLGISNYGSLNPCSLCWANCSNRPWTDFSLNAAWLLLCHTNSQYLARHTNSHPIWAWKGMSKHSIRFDTLHVVDHHGVASHAIGSFFAEICSDRELAPNKDESLEALNFRIRDFQSKHRTSNRCPPLFWKNIVRSPENNNFPELHGPAVKAATTKDLVMFCSALADELNDGTEYKSRRAAMLRHLLKFNTLVDTSPTILSEDGKAQLKTCVHGFLVNYVFLARACALALVLRYHIVPKFHYFAHFPAQADVCSLRDTRCYLEESCRSTFSDFDCGSVFTFLSN
jgi:hypothetical protein